MKDPAAADCPECEYCCLIGLCCAAEVQRAALIAAFVAAGSDESHAVTHADVLVAARLKAQRA